MICKTSIHRFESGRRLHFLSTKRLFGAAAGSRLFWRRQAVRLLKEAVESTCYCDIISTRDGGDGLDVVRFDAIGSGSGVTWRAGGPNVKRFKAPRRS